MYLATEERSFWIVVGLNLCPEFAQLSGSKEVEGGFYQLNLAFQPIAQRC